MQAAQPDTELARQCSHFCLFPAGPSLCRDSADRHVLMEVAVVFTHTGV